MPALAQAQIAGLASDAGFEVRRVQVTGVERMNELKGSYQPPLTLAILAAVGVAPKIVQQQFLDILAAKASTKMAAILILLITLPPIETAERL